jgi:hypothetical protein
LSELKITSRTVTTFYTTVDQTFNKECRVNNAVSGMVMVREKEGCLCLSFRSIGLAGLEKPKSNQTNSNSRPPFVVIVGDRQAPGTIECKAGVAAVFDTALVVENATDYQQAGGIAGEWDSISLLNLKN